MKKGFTLIETVIVLFVMCLAVGAVLFGTSGLLARNKIDEAQEQIVSLLKDARDKTLARDGGAAYGVHLQTTQAIFFRGPTYSAGAASNTAYVLPSDIQISSYALTGGGADVIFTALTGETRNDGTIRLQKVGSSTINRTIRIYASGTIKPE